MAIFLLLVSVWVLGFAWCLSPGPFGRLPGIMSLGWARAGSGLLSLDSARLKMFVGSGRRGTAAVGFGAPRKLDGPIQDCRRRIQCVSKGGWGRAGSGFSSLDPVRRATRVGSGRFRIVVVGFSASQNGDGFGRARGCRSWIQRVSKPGWVRAGSGSSPPLCPARWWVPTWVGSGRLGVVAVVVFSALVGSDLSGFGQARGCAAVSGVATG